MSLDNPPRAAIVAATPLGMTVQDALEEGRRVMSICNACRYCEGYCAVFPALERRLEFTDSDLRYLANLCHNCGECLTSCQYAPPHDFALNLPRNLAQIRNDSYRAFAWPAAAASMYPRGIAAWLLLAASLVALFVAATLGKVARAPAHFYDVLPHGFMASVFGAAGLFVAAALAAMFARFWRDTGERASGIDARALLEAARDAATLRYLGGGGEGCAAGTGPPSRIRALFHHLTAYGFALCFAATAVATWYHYALDWQAPYPLTSLPVILGVTGGLGLVVGPAGLWWLARERDPALSDVAHTGASDALILLLLLTSASGLALLAWRDTAGMPYLLAIHLGIVLALFVAFAYGKFVHAILRTGALLRYAVERRRVVRDVGGSSLP